MSAPPSEAALSVPGHGATCPGMDPDIQLHSPAPEDLTDRLHAGLVAAGQALRSSDMPSFLLTVTDEDALLAGCKGEIAFTSAHISELWVSDTLRGQGIGSALLARAEAHARDQGCTRIHIETRNPAARRLYERHGYHLFGELPDYDGPHSLCYLEKPLD